MLAGVTTVWTIGHSTRSPDEFWHILSAHGIRQLVDVRSFPGSRRYPHFNKQRLSSFLRDHGVTYTHLPALGGRRSPQPNSPNTAWRNAGFRGYADYLMTEEFRGGIKQLLVLANENATAIMCAEAVWWRCHRSLIADYLKVRGVTVVHLLDVAHTEIHPYTTAARVVDGRLSYEGLLTDEGA
jgi:uncharacterized protein (DUF488 family)